MNMSEKQFQLSPEKAVPAGEKEKDLPEILKNIHEVRGQFLSRGVFFDVYDTDIQSEEGRKFVVKDFRSGDKLMSPEEQASLFQHQYYEFERLKSVLGDDFFPESYWLRSGDFSEDEVHGFYKKPGMGANTFSEYIKVQMDRYLRGRHSQDDTHEFSKKIGKLVGAKHEDAEAPFVGGVVQEKIRGVSFEEAMKKIDKNSKVYQKMQENVRNLIRRLETYHAESDFAAFTWHRLGSENVMCETDKDGELTGRVVVVDANFAERPNKAYKKSVEKKMIKNIFEPLEDFFEL